MYMRTGAVSVHDHEGTSSSLSLCVAAVADASAALGWTVPFAPVVGSLPAGFAFAGSREGSMLHWQEFARAVASRRSAAGPLQRAMFAHVWNALGLSHARDNNQPTSPAFSKHRAGVRLNTPLCRALKHKT